MSECFQILLVVALTLLGRCLLIDEDDPCA